MQPKKESSAYRQTFKTQTNAKENGGPADQLAAAVTGKFCLLSSLPVTAGRRHLMRTSPIIAVDKLRTFSLCLCHSVVCFLSVRVLQYALWAESIFSGDENDDDGSHNCDDDYFLDSCKCSLLFCCVFLFVFWVGCFFKSSYSVVLFLVCVNLR